MSVVAEPRPYDVDFRTTRPAFVWLLEREVLRFLKIWPFTVAGPILAALMFEVVFGFALRRHITGMPGIPYDQFILPGLVAQAVVTVGYANGTTSLFDARRDRYFHDVLASPLRWWELNLGLVAGGMVRGALVGAGILLVAVPAAHLPFRSPLVFAGGAAVTLVLAGQLGVLAGAYARRLEHVYSMESLVVVPLTFLGGIFYSVRSLPQPWDAASHLNPVFYVVQVLRIGTVGHGDVPVGVAFAVLGGADVALTLWSALVFRSARLLKP